MRRQIFGEKHPDVATSYSNVGTTFGKLGHHKEALEMLEKALEIRKQIFGDEPS